LGSESLKTTTTTTKNTTYITSFLRKEKSYALIQKQTPVYSVSRHNWNKKSFLAANPPDGFGAHMHKIVPHVYN